MTILAKAGGQRRFRHHRQFQMFYGMDLSTTLPMKAIGNLGIERLSF